MGVWLEIVLFALLGAIVTLEAVEIFMIQRWLEKNFPPKNES